MVSIGFADHVGRVLFTVCVDDRQPPPKKFFDPGKTLAMNYLFHTRSKNFSIDFQITWDKRNRSVAGTI